uniref:CAP-Gly domain-containing protein n=1 Tax=Wuchereria bancrofti TaxID=6293 RepID=A0AAF5PNL6_WUCBA
MAESKALRGLIRSNSRESVISAISHVGDWEIGDRCQIGGRMGNIVYIGPARFAPGEWIGIVLDQPLGKNDGSVDGHRYFSCEPKHGLFCKASKLEHVQSTSLSAETSQNNPFCKEYGLEIGDRVIVSGGKYGRLRFLGNTDFKDGVWAGIELEQPVGKNDGSVQGKRYFTCKAPYGLFAAASKVIRAPEQTSAKFKIRHTKTSALRQRSGSHESLSSIGASSVASSRISKYSFATPRSVHRPLIISSARGQEDLFKAIQESLKEKETHLEQVIRERDLERNEMAALSNRCELAEAKATQLESAKTLVDQQLEALKIMLDKSEAKFKVADGTINDLTIQLKEKKDALEDLTFRYDEETIMNAEMAEKIAELEKRTVVKGSENEDTTKLLMDETEKAKLQLEKLRKQCSLFEQERISVCAEMKNIWSAFNEDFWELTKLLSSNDAVECMDKSETKANDDNRDLSKQLETNMKKLSSLMGHNKTVKKAVQERLESDKEEIKNLTAQLEILKKSMDDKATNISQKDEELTICRATVDQLRNELEKVERSKAKLKETYDALEMSNNALLTNFDHLKKEDAEMVEKTENEKKEHNTEITRLNGELRQAQNDSIQLQEQLRKMEIEKAKLMELRESLENSNRELLTDTKSLESQKIELEGELRQKESENEILRSSLAKKESELFSTKSRLDELSGQIDKLRVNLYEASSSDESLKKELELLREENKKEAEAHIIEVAQLQTTNESLEKDLLTTRNNVQNLENMHDAIKNTLGKTQSELEKLREDLSFSQQELIAEHEKVAKLQQEIVSHVSDMEQLQRLREEASNHAKIKSRLESENDSAYQKLRDLEAEKEILLKEKVELQKEYAKVEERYEALTQSLKGRVSLDSDYKEKVRKLGAELKSITKCLSTVDCKGGSLEEKIGNLLEEKIQLTDAEKKLKVEIERLMAEKENQAFDLTVTTEKLSELKQECNTLAASLNKLEKERDDKDAELNVLRTEMIKISDENKNKDEIINLLKAEHATSTVDLTRNEQYEKEIDVLKEGKNQAISQINSLKLEVLELLKRQAENEGIVSEAKQRSALFIDLEEEWKKKENAYIQEIQKLKVAVGKTETDKIEEMKRDISFLNSIIAEQYKKEKDLNEQIAILNSLPANEIMTELQRKTTDDIPLRLYCDICEVFDLHDTTDCPAQAMDMEEEAVRKKNKKAKPPARPYCEHCEEFGHGASNCSKMQTEKSKSKDYTF